MEKIVLTYFFIGFIFAITVLIWFVRDEKKAKERMDPVDFYISVAEILAFFTILWGILVIIMIPLLPGILIKRYFIDK